MRADEITDQILSQAGLIGRGPWVLDEDERQLLRQCIEQLATEVELHRELVGRGKQ